MSHPYKNLPERAFWKPAVGTKSPFDIGDLWQPKFDIEKQHKWVTFGSCFAQHLSRAIQANGFKWVNAEPAPSWVSEDVKKSFNYGIYSARTGNIYTTTLLLQWLNWAIEEDTVPDEVWEHKGRFYDPFRPAIEPDGFSSKEELVTSRQETIKAFKACMTEANYFVFTMGLTERWLHKSGYEYPMCPGTVAGNFDESEHIFENLKFSQIKDALKQVVERVKQLNPDIKFILTVSPVPLTATQTDDHVLVATMRSKSTLRAVAAEVKDEFDCVDYFPSYEIINSAPYKGMFFEPNQRSVNPNGVAWVMKQFFAGQQLVESKEGEPVDEVCEEAILEAFSKHD